MRSINWKKVLLVTWACLLVFGLSYEVPRAEALDGPCLRECKIYCGKAGCYAAIQTGPCSCYVGCNDGTTGETICVL